jgi:hypothetical protein
MKQMSLWWSFQSSQATLCSVMLAPTFRNSLLTSKKGRNGFKQGRFRLKTRVGVAVSGTCKRDGSSIFGVRQDMTWGYDGAEREEWDTEVGKAKGGAGNRTQLEEVVSHMGPLKGQHAVSSVTGTQWNSTASRKVASSIPDNVIFIFHWHNPSDSTMALGSFRL